MAVLSAGDRISDRFRYYVSWSRIGILHFLIAAATNHVPSSGRLSFLPALVLVRHWSGPYNGFDTYKLISSFQMVNSYIKTKFKIHWWMHPLWFTIEWTSTAFDNPWDLHFNLIDYKELSIICVPICTNFDLLPFSIITSQKKTLFLKHSFCNSQTTPYRTTNDRTNWCHKQKQNF